MVTYGYKETAGCTLCKKAHEESGNSWNRELPKETIGHIQSTGCLGQKEVVAAAHNACIRELLQEIDAHGKADRHMKLLTVDDDDDAIYLFLDGEQVGYTLGSRTVYAILLEGRVVGSSESRGDEKNPVERSE